MEATALLTPEVLDLLSWLTQSFDVEVAPGWMVASSVYGDVTTPDDDVWTWVFSATSRVLDLVRALGAEDDISGRWPGYTSTRVERPRRLDGSLRFLQRSQRTNREGDTRQ